MSTFPAARSTMRALGAAAAIAALVPACGSAANKGAAYCGNIEANLAELESPSIATTADIEATLGLYRSITAGAPLAVQPEWQTVVDNLETAATVDPKDPESMQRAADTARRSESAAARIQQYTQQSCGIDIGTPPPTTNPVTATTATKPTGSTGG